MQPDKSSRWFPNSAQLSDPVALERSFRQLLTQHYALVDRLNAMQKQQMTEASTSISGPTDTTLVGLKVVPVDVSTLADGAALKFSKVNGNLQFS